MGNVPLPLVRYDRRESERTLHDHVPALPMLDLLPLKAGSKKGLGR